MKHLQILNRARTTKIEGVLADADVARVIALTLGDVRQFMFDHGALAQRAASGGRLDVFAESLLKLFILRDGVERPWPISAVVHCARRRQ